MSDKIYTKITSSLKIKMLREIQFAENIVVTSHISPDDDSIASVLIMYYFLINYMNKSPKKVKMIISQEKESTRWEYFSNFEKINFVDDIASHLNKTDLLVILDGSGWKRISRNENVNKYFNGKTICIDHHPKAENIFDLHLIATDFSATSELLYRIFLKNEKLDKNICELILLGIEGDTGSFKYITPNNVQVFDVAKRLVKDGEIKIEEFKSKYEAVPFNVFQIVAYFMSKSVIKEIPKWPKFLFSFITNEEINEKKYKPEELLQAKGLFTEKLKTIEGITWGLFFSPDITGFTNVSGRSLPGSVSIREIMQQLEIGGGHDRAAGGKILKRDTKEAINYLFNWMKENKPSII